MSVHCHSGEKQAVGCMWKEALPTLSPLGLEQTYPKNQGCSALCVLVPTAPSALHSPLMNSFNKQRPACFPGYKRRKQCGALAELRQAREKSQGLLTLASRVHLLGSPPYIQLFRSLKQRVTPLQTPTTSLMARKIHRPQRPHTAGYKKLKTA